MALFQYVSSPSRRGKESVNNISFSLFSSRLSRKGPFAYVPPSSSDPRLLTCPPRGWLNPTLQADPLFLAFGTSQRPIPPRSPSPPLPPLPPQPWRYFFRPLTASDRRCLLHVVSLVARVQFERENAGPGSVGPYVVAAEILLGFGPRGNFNTGFLARSRKAEGNMCAKATCE